MSNLYGNSDKGSVTKYMFWILILSLIPFPIFLYTYMNSPDSVILKFIADNAVAIPGMTSFGSPLLSKVMSSYCKLAPVFGLFFFMLSYGKLNLNMSFEKWKTFRVLVVFLIFYLAASYFLLFYNVELTESKRFLYVMSQSELSMTVLYCLVFSVSYILTCYLFSFMYAAFMVFKK